MAGRLKFAQEADGKPGNMIAIIDYGMGNVGSIGNMLSRIGAKAEIVSDPESVSKAAKIILPGVGAFDNAMSRLKELDLIHVLNERVLHDEVPTLGLCLGMHLFCHRSEEGVLPGLGWVDADVRRFDFSGGSPLPIPHMGWNRVATTTKKSVLSDPTEGTRYYFAHSFHAVCGNDDDVIGTADYGYRFHCGFQHGNVTGLQFHPEKSHRFGKQVLTNFSEL